jgi:hypothetical protein
MTVHSFPERDRHATNGPNDEGEPPMDNGTMEDIDKRLTVVEATMATKADLSGLETRLIKWTISAMGAMTAALAALMTLFKFLH